MQHKHNGKQKKSNKKIKRKHGWSQEAESREEKQTERLEFAEGWN
jgi:hypothetical protein